MTFEPDGEAEADLPELDIQVITIVRRECPASPCGTEVEVDGGDLDEDQILSLLVQATTLMSMPAGMWDDEDDDE